MSSNRRSARRRLSRRPIAILLGVSIAFAPSTARAATTERSLPEFKLAAMRPAPRRATSPQERIAELRARVERMRARAAASPSGPAATDVPMLGCGEWNELAPDAPPLGLYAHTMIYDPVRDRLVVFGGITLAGPMSDEVWTLDLSAASAWTPLATSGAPPAARYDHSAIYDAPRDRMIVFGGADQTYSALNDVWALDLATSTWTQLAPAGTLPSPRWTHSAIFDSARDRMVVFAGLDSQSIFNDVWSLTLSGSPAWSQLSPSGTAPAERYDHTAIYDAPRDRMVVFGGGVSMDPGMANDVWSLSFAGGGTWTEMLPSGTPPLPRSTHAALFDAPRNRMIVFGGFTVDADLNYFDANDLWSLPFTGGLKWAKLNPATAPPALEQHAITYDATRQRLVSFGGYINASADQVWAVGLSVTPAWTEIVGLGQTPRQRSDHTAIYDAERHRMVIFGGSSESATPLNDAWAFSLTSPGWTKFATTTAGPALMYQAAAIDSAHERLIVFSGMDGNYHVREEVWALSLSGTPNWTKLNPSGGPPEPRTDAAAIYDPGRGRIVIHGGLDSLGNVLDDTWALSLSGGGAWTKLSPSGTPPAFSDHAAIYDRPRDRMIVLAGNDANPPGSPRLWQLSFAGAGAWSAISTIGDPPFAYGPQTVFDGARNRMLAFASGNDVYALPLAGPPAWSRIGADPSLDLRDYATAIFDAEHDRAVMYGGHSPAAYLVRGDVQAFAAAADLIVVRGTASPPPGGTVTADPAGPCYSTGSQVTLTATPSQGFQFTGWSGDAGGMDNPLAVTADAEKAIVANFVQPPPSCDGWRLLLLQSGELPMIYPSIVYDPVGHRALAFGASSNFDQLEDEVWELPLTGGPADWQPLATTGAPPPFRYFAEAAYDAARNRMLVYGGTDISNQIDYDDVWALSLTGTPAWSQVIAPGSGGGLHVFGSVIYDPVRDRLLVFGGRYLFTVGDATRNDIRALNLSGTPTWTELTPINPPGNRSNQMSIYDPVHDRLVVFGGFQRSDRPYADTWALSLTGTPAWSRLLPVGETPAASGGGRAIYDPARDRMVLFGGAVYDARLISPTGPMFDHVFSLSLPGPAWSRLTPDGLAPGPRYDPAAVYDPENDRMIVTNGFEGFALYHYETHALSFAGGNWLVAVPNRPDLGSVLRSGPGDCLDPGASVTLTAVPGPNATFVGWSGDASGDENPIKVTMNGHKTVVANFDVLTAALLGVFVADRRDGAVRLHWEFSSPALVASSSVERADQAAGPWQAVALETRPDGGGVEAVDPTADPGRDYLYRLQVALQSGGRMTFGPVAVEAASRVSASDLRLRSPNPATGAVRFDVALARAGRLRVGVYDVAGREVAVLAEGSRDAGTLSLAWDGRDARGRLAAGLFIVRLSAPDRTVTRRITLIR